MVAACLVNFIEHLSFYARAYQTIFLCGVWSFLASYLFLYDFREVYQFGQKNLEAILGFLAPLNQTLTNVFSFYFIFSMILFYLLKIITRANSIIPYFVFIAGFTSVMHVILSARDFQGQEKALFKPTYLFWMCVIVIVNVVLLVLYMDLSIDKLTLMKFLKSAWSLSIDYYRIVLKSLNF